MKIAWLMVVFATLARGVLIVRNLSDIRQDSYGRPGLSHMTVAGAVHHGMKEIEIWLQTFAPGSRTPIHRHDCEEVFLVLKGAGTLFLAAAGDDKIRPGTVTQFHFSANSTITVPVNAVHQIINTGDKDLQSYVIISRPPIKVFVYSSFSEPHAEAAAHFPYPWDLQCLADEGDDGATRLCQFQ